MHAETIGAEREDARLGAAQHLREALAVRHAPHPLLHDLIELAEDLLAALT